VINRNERRQLNHLDTAYYYGLGVANELIHEALHPYPDDLVLVSKVGAKRDAGGGLHDAQRPEELRERKWHLPGCYSSHRTCCSSRAPRRSSIRGRTWP
jgi:aryl-alcohol dehydrogenase-like predicted oxidoreductase